MEKEKKKAKIDFRSVILTSLSVIQTAYCQLNEKIPKKGGEKCLAKIKKYKKKAASSQEKNVTDTFLRQFLPYNI